MLTANDLKDLELSYRQLASKNRKWPFTELQYTTLARFAKDLREILERKE